MPLRLLPLPFSILIFAVDAAAICCFAIAAISLPLHAARRWLLPFATLIFSLTPCHYYNTALLTKVIVSAYMPLLPFRCCCCPPLIFFAAADAAATIISICRCRHTLICRVHAALPLFFIQQLLLPLLLDADAIYGTIATIYVYTYLPLIFFIMPLRWPPLLLMFVFAIMLMLRLILRYCCCR